MIRRLGFTVMAFLTSAVPAYAQIRPVPIGDPLGILPGVDPTIAQYTDAELVTTKILNYFIGLVGIIAVIMLVLGGFWFLTSGGNDEQATKGKKTITYAIIGIIVVVLSYAIVATLTKEAAGGFGGGGSSDCELLPPIERAICEALT